MVAFKFWRNRAGLILGQNALESKVWIASTNAMDCCRVEVASPGSIVSNTGGAAATLPVIAKKKDTTNAVILKLTFKMPVY